MLATRLPLCLGLGLCLGCWSIARAVGGAVGDARDAEGRQGCAYGGKVYAVGERWVTGPPDKCAKFLCQDDDQFVALTCPWFVPAPGCTPIPGDDRDVYPGCCPTRKCHDPVDHQDKDGDEATTVEATTRTPPTSTQRTMSWRPARVRGVIAESTAGPPPTDGDEGYSSREEDADEAVTPTMAPAVDA